MPIITMLKHCSVTASYLNIKSNIYQLQVLCEESYLFNLWYLLYCNLPDNKAGEAAYIQATGLRDTPTAMEDTYTIFHMQAIKWGWIQFRQKHQI